MRCQRFYVRSGDQRPRLHQSQRYVRFAEGASVCFGARFAFRSLDHSAILRVHNSHSGAVARGSDEASHDEPAGWPSRPRAPIIRCRQARSVIEIIRRDLLTSYNCFCKRAITSKIKHAIKHKTSPARLAQLLHNSLQPSLAFRFRLQPVTAYRPVLDGTPSFDRTCFKFYCMFYFTCDCSLNDGRRFVVETRSPWRRQRLPDDSLGVQGDVKLTTS